MNLIEKLYSKIGNKNKHKIIALGYACIIAVAFLLSMSKNTPVVASVSNESLGDIAYTDYIDEDISNIDNEFSNVDDSGIFGNLKNILKTEESYIPTERLSSKEVTIEKGDNFIGILTQKIGMPYNEAASVVSEMKKIYNPANLRIGQKIKFEFFEKIENAELISLEKVSIPASKTKRFVLTKNIEEKYVAKIEEDNVSTKIFNTSGKIEGNLSTVMSKKDVPNTVIADFISIFSFSVDFKRDIRNGDKFELIYEKQVNDDGQAVAGGNILYASLKLRNEKISLYRFKASNGSVDYYNEKGIALKKNLDRKPLAFRNARVSSPFGRRRHPVLKTLKVHWGIDYAAPRGTAIYAGGDGTVQAAAYNGAYGNYVKIKHNSEYSTAYGHMHNIAKGIRPGTRVKQGQVIGYVGSTGRSTGPHLHYEVIQNGKRINPTTIRASTGENLTGKNFASFKSSFAKFKTDNKEMFAQMESDKEVASAK